MVYQHPNVLNEYIKCVIVGDSRVGKTCLVTSWACDSRFKLKSLVKTHQSSVWATDHYRNDPKILDRSVTDVDGVQVSLRLWDTFGRHETDRGFAYRGADVVLLCFSVVEPRSLINLRKTWIPEIQRRATMTPVVVVGCQADLRYLYMDEEYLSLDKGLMYKVTQAKDIVRPEQGRNVARMIGAPYYECSILTKYGVDDVFVNVIRAAMVEKRKLRFWSSQLRRIRFPQIQAPMKPPVPKFPCVVVPPATLNSDICKLLFDQSIGDVIFIVHSQWFRAHKVCLAVASDVFENLFILNNSESTADVHVTEKELITLDNEVNKNPLRVSQKNGSVPCDQKTLLDNEELQSLSDSLETLPTTSDKTSTTSKLDNKPITSHQSVLVSSHPAFISMEDKKSCDNPFQPGTIMQQTVITLNRDITPRAFQYILEYLYTGTAKEDFDSLEEAKRAATLLQMSDLVLRITNIQSGETFLNMELNRRFVENRKQKLRKIALEEEKLIDIVFKVDDGVVAAHKPLLMARCEMMYAMFNDNFLEASAEEIPFPGITCEAFRALRHFLYTEDLSMPCLEDCMDIIEVANRLCLPRLVKLVEASVVQELTNADRDGDDIIEDVLMLLEPAQLYNADQLADWCIQYLSNHYLPLRQRYMKILQRLRTDNITAIELKRWPPEWYVNEMKQYDTVVSNHSNSTRRRKETSFQQKNQFSRWEQCTNGCLCFIRRSKILEDVESMDLPA